MSTSEGYSQFYEKVYTEHDPKPDGAHGWIQWKGTDICIDLHCNCGAFLHFDGESMYFIQCPYCKQIYAAGQNIKLIPITPEDLKLGGIDIETIKCPDDDENMHS